jgi:hypothetical protein
MSHQLYRIPWHLVHPGAPLVVRLMVHLVVRSGVLGSHMVLCRSFCLVVRWAARRGSRLGARLAARRGFHLMVHRGDLAVRLAVHWIVCHWGFRLTVYLVRLVPHQIFRGRDPDAVLCNQSHCHHCRRQYRIHGSTVCFGDVVRVFHCFCLGSTVCFYVSEKIGPPSDDCPRPAGTRFALRHCTNWLAAPQPLRESLWPLRSSSWRMVYPPVELFCLPNLHLFLFRWEVSPRYQHRVVSEGFDDVV